MARFDVYRPRSQSGYVIDCQADLLDDLSTRFVVPLLPPHDAPKPFPRLNPVFDIGDGPHVMVTQFAAALPVNELGDWIASLAGRDTDIGNALDMLLVGF